MTQPDPNNHRNPSSTENRFSGLYPDESYPLVDGELDFEQQKELQARQESDRTRRWSTDAPHGAHPPFTERGPDAARVVGLINPTSPTYNSITFVLTVPTKTNIQYYDVTNRTTTTDTYGVVTEQGVVLLPAGDRTLTATTIVEARAAAGYDIPATDTKQWTYTV